MQPLRASSAHLSAELSVSEAERLILLAEISSVLGASLDSDTSLARALDLLVPRWSECCLIQRVGRAGQAKPPIVRLWPPNAVLEAQVRESLLHRTLEDIPEPELRRLLGTGGERSILRCRLDARGRTLGHIALLGGDSARGTSLDLDLVEDIANRAAVAIQNDELYEEAYEAVRIREEAIATVAHDLKNPLAVIKGTLHMLLAAAGDRDEIPMTRRRLTRLLRAGVAMEGLIGGLLDDVSIQSGRLSLKQEPMDAKDVLADAYELFHGLAADRKIRFEVAIPEVSVTVRCDRARILQVFSNLIGNSLKHTPAGGVVTIEARPREGAAEFSVADTGVGIAAEHLPYLFDRYRRPDRLHRTGTGLGLSIARGIIEAHGGRISANSVPNEGTRISFWLPTERSST
jgi:signal transduction histidine kinase